MVQRSHGVHRLRKKISIKSFVKDNLNKWKNLSNQEIADICRKEFNSKTKATCISWYKGKLKDASSVTNVTKTKRATKVSDEPITLTTIFSTFKKYIEPNCRMLGESIDGCVKMFFDGKPTFANFRYQSEKNEVAKMVVRVVKPELKKLTNVKLRALVEDADRVRYKRSRDRAERYGTREVPHCIPSSTYDAFGGNGRLYLLTHEKYQEILKVMLKNKAEKETFFGKSVTVTNVDYGTYLAVGQSEIRISVKIHEGKLTIL